MNLFTPGNRTLKKEIYSLLNQIEFDRHIGDTAIIPGWEELATSMVKSKTILLEEKKSLLFRLEPSQKN